MNRKSLIFPRKPVECTNARIKEYPNHAVLQVANADIFPVQGHQVRDYDVPPAGQGKDHEKALEASRRRAKSRIRDIALCNSFSHFFTWTLDGSLIDRYDPDKVYKKLRAVLSNAVQRNGFQYVIVPEFHRTANENGEHAIHFHGLCNLGTLPLERAVSPYTGIPMTDKSGRPVFNLPAWKWGFSTVVPIDESYERAVNYVTKYITKNSEKIFGKWYLASRNLTKSPHIELIDHMDFDEFLEDEGADCFVVDCERFRLASKEL